VLNYAEEFNIVAVEDNGAVKLHSVAVFTSKGARVVNDNDFVCSLLQDGKSLALEETVRATCSGNPEIGCNGQPWYEATYSATFALEQ
jgi:hypothetical protein